MADIPEGTGGEYRGGVDSNYRGELVWEGWGGRLMQPFLYLFSAALFAVGGSALLRWGRPSGQAVGWVLGMCGFFLYSLLVNQPRWGFGLSLGLYIVLFFLMTQAADMLFFGKTFTRRQIVSTLFITVGGICLLIWK